MAAYLIASEPELALLMDKPHRVLPHLRADSQVAALLHGVLQVVAQWIEVVERGRRGAQFHVSLDQPSIQ